MDPLTALATGYAGDKITSLAERMIKTHVIERWTRKRAVEFYRTFCGELLDNKVDSASLEERLSELINDEAKSEILFEAYRLVCLSKSKAIGPRIIAVVVAEIVQRDAIANDEEEIILAAAETFSDDELLAFRDEVRRLRATQPSPTIQEITDTRSIDSNFSDTHVETGAGSLAEHYGPWAEKMRGLGLITESVRERTYRYQEDSERHIDMDGSVRQIEWRVHFPQPCSRLADLIDQLAVGRTP
jgi:hypothetical protein